MPQTLSRQLVTECLRDPSRVRQAVYRRARRVARQVAHLGGRLPAIGLDAVAPPLADPAEIILDDISLPPPHPDFITADHDDVTPLLRIAAARQPKLELEMGAAYGNTVANLCRVCDAQIVTVNALPEQISGHFATDALTKEQIGRVYRDFGFAQRVTQIYANTLDFDSRAYFPEPAVELAIIDACHDTDYVLNDFEKVLPTLAAQAVVLFHDTHPSLEDHLVGSYAACVKLRRRGFNIRHIRGTWWAIWQKTARGEFST